MEEEFDWIEKFKSLPPEVIEEMFDTKYGSENRKIWCNISTAIVKLHIKEFSKIKDIKIRRRFAEWATRMLLQYIKADEKESEEKEE